MTAMGLQACPPFKTRLSFSLSELMPRGVCERLLMLFATTGSIMPGRASKCMHVLAFLRDLPHHTMESMSHIR